MAHGTQSPILLVSCPPWRTECPNLALAYLSAMLRTHGFSTWVADFNVQFYNRMDPPLRRYWDLTSSNFWTQPQNFRLNFGRRMLGFIEGFASELAERPGNLIGFSTQSANVMFTLELVRMIRRRGCKKTIVLGGPAVRLRNVDDARSLGLTGFKAQGFDETAAEREIREYLDLVDVFVEGEGEMTLLELAQRHREGAPLEGTPGAVVWNHGQPAPFVPREAAQDLGEFPPPTFEEFELGLYSKKVLPFLTSRGCVRKCAMCYERVLWPGYRHRSVAAIVAEMQAHQKRWGIHEFSCNDLLLNGNLVFLGQLCDALASARLPVNWWGNAVVHRLMDRGLFQRMRAGGLTALVYGIESGSQKILRKMRKGYLIEDADNVLRWGKELGINNVVNLIVGFPGETAEDHQATVDFVRRNHESIHQVGVLATCIVYPQSPLATQAEYFGLDPDSLQQYNPFSINVDWKDTNGLDLATRQERFWELYRLLRSHGIEVVGVEEEEDLTPERIAELAARLESPTAWVREDAVLRLARAKDSALAPAMVRLLEDPSFLVRGQALMNLSRLDPDRAWEEAAPLLTRTLSYVDHAAAVALATRMDIPSMDLLEHRLGSRKYARHNSELQRALARHRKHFEAFEGFQGSVETGDARAVPTLLSCTFEWVPVRGLRWLEEVRLDRAFQHEKGLREGIHHPSVEVRRRILRILRKAKLRVEPRELEDVLASGDARVRAEATRLLAANLPPGTTAGLPACDHAMQALRVCQAGFWLERPIPSGEDLEFLRILALGAAADGPRPPDRPTLPLRALHEGSPHVRLAALEALLEWQDWRYKEEVLAVLGDSDARVRGLALEYLGRTGDRGLQYRLLPFLDDRNLRVGQEATAALARLQSPLMPERLASFVKGTPPEELPDFMVEPIRACLDLHQKATALAPAVERSEPAAVLAAFSAGNSMFRVFVLENLEKCALNAVHSAVLRVALVDREPEVRVAALRLMEALAVPDMEPDAMALIKDPDPLSRAAVCRYLSRMRHAAARPAFLEMLHDGDPNVREWAARALGRIGNSEDVKALSELLQEANFSRLSEASRADLQTFYEQVHGQAA